VTLSAAHVSSPVMDALGGALGQFVRPGGLADPVGGPGVGVTLVAVALAWAAGLLTARAAGYR
jgi:hypothetical protein